MPRRPWSYRLDQQVNPNDLQQAIDFLIMRFTSDAPRWQLAIWLRQLTLSLLLFCVDFFAYMVDTEQSASRYVFASIALVIMILWWWAHARVRPYYFNSQNAMESWFYGCNVLLVILGMAYTAVSDNVESRTVAGRNILLGLEVMLEIDLIGGIVLIILYFLYDLRRQRRSLACVDLVAALDITRQKIDKPVMKQLQDGSIRLLRCGWLLSDEADSVLREDTEDHGVVVRMRRCQELPEAAFFSPEEAAELFGRGDRSVLVLSYRWQIAAHPDPLGTTLATVRGYLSNEASVDSLALFWDFASLPQKPRTEDETDQFKSGLKVMGFFYASVTGTAVIQVKDMPPRPRCYDGKVVIFNLQAHQLSEFLLSQDLSRFGIVVNCRIDAENGVAGIQFESHDAAERACNELEDADLLYNGRGYDRSGWCTFEQASSRTVASHLAKAEENGELPKRYARAQESRAKVVELSDGEVRISDETVQEPTALLEQALADLDTAVFIGKGDRAVVKGMLLDLEWNIKTALARAEDAMLYGSKLTIDVTSKLSFGKLRVLPVKQEGEEAATKLQAAGRGKKANWWMLRQRDARRRRRRRRRGRRRGTRTQEEAEVEAQELANSELAKAEGAQAPVVVHEL